MNNMIRKSCVAMLMIACLILSSCGVDNQEATQPVSQATTESTVPQTIATQPSTVATEPPETIPVPVQIPEEELKDYAQRLVDVENNPDFTEEKKVRQVVYLLLDAKRVQFATTSSEPFDFSIFWSATSEGNEGIDAFVQHVIRQKSLFAETMILPAYSRCYLTFKNIEIDGISAEVEVYEWLEFTNYYINTEQFADRLSGMGKTFTVKLEKEEAGWRIADIDAAWGR